MKTRTVEILEKEAFIVPFGDLHIGDKAFNSTSKNKLDTYIKFVKEHDNARVILNGDLLNTATRESKTSPFEQDMTLEEQVSEVARLLYPIKDKIIGAVCGNHERRIMDFAGYDPTLSILYKLGLNPDDIYFKFTGLIKLKVGKRTGYGVVTGRTCYTVVFSHTTGGGKLIGSKLNRIDQMRYSTVTNADLYIGSHNHALAVAPVISMEYDSNHDTINERVQYLVDAGAYLDWNGSYAEAMQLQPMKIGSPIIQFSGSDKDINVTL